MTNHRITTCLPPPESKKTRITLAFLRRKETEYKAIKQEIAALRSELDRAVGIRAC